MRAVVYWAPGIPPLVPLPPSAVGCPLEPPAGLDLARDLRCRPGGPGTSGSRSASPRWV